MTSASSKVVETYRAMHPKSAALYERARAIIPGGVTHDGRHMKPFPVYVERALGSHKWDVDGHDYVDYWMGHGALFLGHCHPKVVKAIQEQAARGTHFGASHELEVRWAELITKLIPSAEMVRFAMSGTEATHLALRIARAFTGRNKVVKFQGHFHGWHDGVVAAVNPPYDVPMSAGVPESVLDQLLICPPNDIKSVDTHARARRRRGGDPRAGRRPVRHHAHHPGVSPGAAQPHHAPQGGADLRRGDHRLPLRAGWRPGLLRRDPRHDHAGQDRGRRPARRRRRRQEGAALDDGPPRRAGLRPEPARGPERHVQLQPGVRRRRHRHARAGRRRRRSTRAPTRRATSCARACRTR